MTEFLYFSYALLYLLLFVWCIRIANTYQWVCYGNVILLVIISLIYDNTIIALGAKIGEGSMLKALTTVRYWLHAIVTPLLVLYGLDTLHNAKIQWAKSKWSLVLSWLLVAVLIAIEMFTLTSDLALKANLQSGILTYEHTEQVKPIMVMAVSGIIFIIGFIIWIKQKWPWLFLATLVLGIGSMMNITSKGGVWMNGLELLFITSLVWTKHMQARTT